MLTNDQAVLLVLVLAASGLFWLSVALYARRVIGAVLAVALVAVWWWLFGWLAWRLL